MELKNIPSMTELLKSNEFSTLDINLDILKKIINIELKSYREKIQKNSDLKVSITELKNQILMACESILNAEGKIVINGTGVVLHTNLGRSPIPKDISKNVFDLISNYSDLEININQKKRNSRISKTSELLKLLTGCESSGVFNNGAMALVVCLSALGKNKEILVSRSESIEIGGGFRIPEIIKMSGQKIIDIGTTNKTYLRDYENNITEKTIAILKVHKSNYKIDGFTSEVGINELSNLGKKFNIPVIHDIGSGNFMNTVDFDLPYEPKISESVDEGADITLFSGDKLLGGPQCGIIVGKKNYIEKINKSPLARASRVDKLNLYILNSILIKYLSNDPKNKLSSWELINLKQKDLEKRGKNILQKLPSNFFSLEKTSSTVGGGTFPEANLDSIAVVMHQEKLIMKLETFLLNLKTPILGKIENGMLMLDLRTIFPEYDSYLIENLNIFFNNDSF